MTPPAGTVDHAALTLGRRLGQGGQGTVYEVANRRINESDGGGWPVVYKEYAAEVLPGLDAAALRSSVALLGRLSAAEGAWLCEKTAWPAALVERSGQPCGFLMRAVPDRFTFALRSLSGGSAGTQRLANLEYLLNDDAYVAGIGLTISDRDRLGILADLASTLVRLHRVGITVGDLSPKNLLFSTAPDCACFLIDCDAMRLRGATVLPQAETPDWQVPAGEEKATGASDVYKLALLAVRLLARDQTTTDVSALAAVDAGLGSLARASLTSDPAHRPTPSAWAEQLASARRTASATAPTVTARGAGGQGGGRAGANAGRPTAGAAAGATGGAGTGGSGSSGSSGSSGGSGSTGGTGGASGAGGTGGGAGSTGGTGGDRFGRIGAAVAAAVVAVIVAVAVANGDGDSSNTASDYAGSSPTPTYSDTYTPPYDDPTDDPYTPPADEDDEDDEHDDFDTPSYDPPDESTPTYEPPPPPPRPDYYGAIAVSSDGAMGKAWDYKSESAAKQGALDRCSSSYGCKVLVTFVNGCGAVAHNSSTRQYWGGRGDTQTAAKNDAIANAGGGRWVTCVCTTRYTD